MKARAYAIEVGVWRINYTPERVHFSSIAITGEQAFPELYGMTAWEYRAAHPDEDAVFNATMTKGEMLQSCCNPSRTHPDRAGKQ